MSGSSPALRALIFDVDGTLADTEETHRLAFNAAFQELRLPFTWDPSTYTDLLRIGGGKERLTHFFTTLETSAVERERLTALLPEVHRRKTDRFVELVALGSPRLRPGIERLLGEAERAGRLLGIASTTTLANVVALLEAQLGREASRRFSVIACGDVVEAKKPAPDIYEYALARLGVGAAEAVAFEDSAIGLTAAKSAGLFTVVTPTHWSHSQDFTGADLLRTDVGDLTLERLDALHAQRHEPQQPRGGALP